MNEQLEFWKGEFGNEYTARNSGDFDAMYEERFGISQTEINEKFLSVLPTDSKILEVGCNRGIQLGILKRMGFSDLTGIEINKSAIELAKEDKDLCILEGSALDLPFEDNSFDLVFTSGVLIHIAPENLPKAMKEIVRVSKKYIFGVEYFSEKCEEIEYRGNKNRLWKNNFPQVYLENNPNVKLAKSEQLKYQDGSGNVDVAFLFEKNA